MIQNKIKKLKALIERLSMLDSGLRETMSREDFIVVEDRLGYKLSDDYKYFCSQLGRSLLDNFINVYCLNNEFIDQSNEVIVEMIEKINYGLKIKERDKENGSEDPYPGRDDGNYIELLKSSLVFAEFNGDRAIFWDLRTYKLDDDSYDIYWYSIDCPDAEQPIKIGRSFTDFICDFCYGQLACELILDFCSPEDSREVSYICG